MLTHVYKSESHLELKCSEQEMKVVFVCCSETHAQDTMRERRGNQRILN